jgi:hypothetical protein
MAAYMKHATLGNRHVEEADVAKLEGEGWVRWPRPRHVKAAAPQAQDVASSPPGGPESAGAAPAATKRKGKAVAPSADDLV